MTLFILIFFIVVCISHVTGVMFHGRDGATIKAIAWFNQKIELQCHVDEADLEFVVWKKYDQLLAVGPVVFANKASIKLLEHGVMQISAQSSNDSGIYSCQPGANVPLNLKQSFDVEIREFFCKAITPPLNAYVNYSFVSANDSYPNGTIATFQCDEGFASLSPYNTSLCCICYDGWSANNFTCLAKEFLEFQKQMKIMEESITEKMKEYLKPLLSIDNKFKILQDKISVLHETQRNGQELSRREISRWNNSINQYKQNVDRLQSESNVRYKMFSNKLRLLEDYIGILYNRSYKQMYFNKQFVDSLSKSINRQGNSNLTKHFLKGKIGQIQTVIEGQTRRLERDVKNIDNKLKKLMGKLEKTAITNDITSLWENMQRHPVATMQIVNGGLVQDYLWIVYNIESKISRIKTMQDSYLATQSSFFYTSIPGYRMRLVLYPDFEKTSNIGLFAGLSPGDFDDDLAWPFHHDYHLAIISHQPNVRDHVGMIELPSNTCDTKKFFRPKAQEIPSACGFRHFLSHDLLRQKEKAYKTNGHIWIRIRIFL